MKKTIALALSIVLVLATTVSCFAGETKKVESADYVLLQIESIFPEVNVESICNQYGKAKLNEADYSRVIEQYEKQMDGKEYTLSVYADYAIGFTVVEDVTIDRAVMSSKRISYTYIAAAIHILEMIVNYQITSSLLTINYITPGGTNVVLYGYTHGTNTASVWGNAYVVHPGDVVQEYVGLTLSVTFNNDGTYTKTETPGVLY